MSDVVLKNSAAANFCAPCRRLRLLDSRLRMRRCLRRSPRRAAGRRARAAAGRFQLFTAQQIQDDVKALEASPGNNNLVQGKNFAVVLTVETAKSARSSSGTRDATTFYWSWTGRRSTRWAERRKARTARRGRMACAGSGGSDDADAEEGRHAGDSARHVAQAEHRGKRDVYADFAAGKVDQDQ